MNLEKMRKQNARQIPDRYEILTNPENHEQKYVEACRRYGKAMQIKHKLPDNFQFQVTLLETDNPMIKKIVFTLAENYENVPYVFRRRTRF